MNNQNKMSMEDIRFIELVSVGSVNPNNPLSEESIKKQNEKLNKCLNEYPKGIIIGKDVTIGRYMIGAHELTMEKTTYHVGFSREPLWLKKEKS